MKLIDAKDWKAVHFGDRTILRSDRNLYPEADWWALVSSVDVEPMKEPGHFKVVPFPRFIHIAEELRFPPLMKNIWVKEPQGIRMEKFTMSPVI